MIELPGYLDLVRTSPVCVHFPIALSERGGHCDSNIYRVKDIFLEADLLYTVETVIKSAFILVMYQLLIVFFNYLHWQSGCTGVANRIPCMYVII
jgi:hypothetical protein